MGIEEPSLTVGLLPALFSSRYQLRSREEKSTIICESLASLPAATVPGLRGSFNHQKPVQDKRPLLVVQGSIST
jgi:hypothetical protein